MHGHLRKSFLRRLETAGTEYRRIGFCRAALFPLNRINTSARPRKKGNPGRIHPHLDSHLMVSHRSILILQKRHLHQRFDSFHAFLRSTKYTHILLDFDSLPSSSANNFSLGS